MNNIKIKIENKLYVMKLIIEQYKGGVISLEGSFDILHFNNFEDIKYENYQKHKRNTTYPIQSFVVFPLTDNNLNLLEKFFHNIGIKKNIEHLIITYEDNIVFATYDNFHPKCIYFSDTFNLDLLKKLKNDKYIIEE